MFEFEDVCKLDCPSGKVVSIEAWPATRRGWGDGFWLSVNVWNTRTGRLKVASVALRTPSAPIGFLADLSPWAVIWGEIGDVLKPSKEPFWAAFMRAAGLEPFPADDEVAAHA